MASEPSRAIKICKQIFSTDEDDIFSIRQHSSRKCTRGTDTTAEFVT